MVGKRLSEAPPEAITNRRGKRDDAPWLFGAPTGPDPSEAGRRGGIKSGITRRQKPLRQLEQRVAQTGNGYALVRLLDRKREDEAALLAERRRADEEVQRLEAEARQVEQRIVSLREDCQDLETERDELDAKADASDVRLRELEQRVAELDERAVEREHAESDPQILVELLRRVGEQRVEVALRSLGWVDDESERA